MPEYNIEFTLPKKDNSGNLINPEAYNDIIQDIINVAGGVTIDSTVYGCWYDEDVQNYMCEENMLVKVWVSDDSSKKQIEDIVRRAARKFGQKLIIIEEGEVNLVDAYGRYRSHLGKKLIMKPLIQPHHPEIKGKD